MTSLKGLDAMTGQRINRFSGRLLILLSVIALLTVLAGYIQGPQPDEGSAAHIFHMSLVVLVPVVVLFVATLDRKRQRGARPLLISAIALVLAFGALYYLEHFR